MVDPHTVDIAHNTLSGQLGEDAVHVIVVAVKFLSDPAPCDFVRVVLVNIIQQSMDFDQRFGIAAFMLLKCCNEMLAGDFNQPFGELQGG
ncbi:hypothetical protein D3C81_1913480 [compost metagenome]